MRVRVRGNFPASLAGALGSSPRPAIQKKKRRNTIMDNELREAAKYMRECADILDEISECKDKDKAEELMGRFIVKFAKLMAVVGK